MAVIVAARFASYVVSIVGSLFLIGRLMSVPSRLARVLAAVMAAWLLNSLILLSYLVWQVITGENSAPWRDITLTLNAVFLAACPVALYWCLSRLSGDGKV